MTQPLPQEFPPAPIEPVPGQLDLIPLVPDPTEEDS